MNTQQAQDRVRQSGGPELLERLLHLDHVSANRASPEPPSGVRPPEAGDAADYDLIMAGGGLSLLYAPLLARKGVRVAVVERSSAGAAHREWNASRRELQALTDSGLFSREEIDRDLIVARYREGICQWHGGGRYAVKDVLDCAVDANALMKKTRALSEQAGVTLIDGTIVKNHAASPSGVRLALEGRSGGPSELTCRVMLDARGASSPYATADLICPTVGGVMRGITVGEGPKDIQPDVGEILVTTEGIDDGHQHLWEAFPAAADETTVYLFYYQRRAALKPLALTRLYARYFDRFAGYKHGQTTMVRPTFGLIPGWSRLTRAPRPVEPQIVLVGDAAARHSPLTFCGFGATLRSLRPAVAGILQRLENVGDDAVVHDAPIHQGTGALAMMLACPPLELDKREGLNQLLDAAFGTLAEMGQTAFGELLRDEMSGADFIRFLHQTSLKQPSVYTEVFRRLGIVRTGRWAASLARKYAMG